MFRGLNIDIKGNKVCFKVNGGYEICKSADTIAQGEGFKDSKEFFMVFDVFKLVFLKETFQKCWFFVM